MHESNRHQNINEKLLILTKGLPIVELHRLSEIIIKKSTIQTALVFCVPFSLTMSVGAVAQDRLINSQSLLLYLILSLFSIFFVLLIMKRCFDSYWKRLSLYFLLKNETKEFERLIKRNKTTLSVLELRYVNSFLASYNFFEDIRRKSVLLQTEEAEIIKLIEREINVIEEVNAHEQRSKFIHIMTQILSDRSQTVSKALLSACSRSQGKFKEDLTQLQAGLMGGDTEQVRQSIAGLIKKYESDTIFVQCIEQIEEIYLRECQLRSILSL